MFSKSVQIPWEGYALIICRNWAVGFGREGFHEKDAEGKLIIVRTGYVLGGFLLSLEENNEEGCFIKEPNF